MLKTGTPAEMKVRQSVENQCKGKITKPLTDQYSKDRALQSRDLFKCWQI